jgi:Protein of unknown function (DUF3352)
MTAFRPLAAAATCALALVAAACGGATPGAAPGAAGTAGKAADAFPVSTLFFVDANADVNSSAWKKVRTVASRFPGYAKLEGDLLKKISAPPTAKESVSFARDIAPWAGHEVAVGVLAITLSGGKPAPQAVVYVESKDDAAAIAAATAKGAKKTGEYKGYAEFATEQGKAGAGAAKTDAAVGKGAVLFATDTTSLHEAIDAREGPASDRLSASATFAEALGTLPGDNLLVGYADGPKIAQLAGTAFEAAAGAGGGANALPAAQVDKLLTQLEALRAIAFSAGADDNGFRLQSSTLLDPAKMKQIQSIASDTLTLVDRAPADALLYAGTPGFGDQLKQSIKDATTSSPEVAKGIAGIEAMTGLSVANDVLPLLSGELGLYVSGGAPAKGGLLLKPADAAAGAASLTKITAAIAKQGGKDAPKFAPLPTGEGQLTTLSGHDLSWLHEGDLVALGFDTGGAAPGGGLGQSDRFHSVGSAANVPAKVGGLLYADIPGLVDLAQRSGSGPIPADALANVRALGGLLAWSTQDGAVAKAELYVQVPSSG